MSVAGNRLRTASRIASVGLALLLIRAAVACGGSTSETESDSCKQRGGHCASGGAVAACTREETPFADTCLCCVPTASLPTGDDDDAAVADSAVAADSTAEASTPVTDAASSDAADGGG
jgi:hypothetical protein